MKYIIISIILLFVTVGVSQDSKNVSWDTSYIETRYSIEYLVWKYENSNSDTTTVYTNASDTSTLMPVIRAKRDEYHNKYLRDSTRAAQSKLLYDAKLEHIILIESK